MELKGKTALVTGASRGIGKAIALELAGMGATLVLTARNEARLKETVAEIEKLGCQAQSLTFDISHDGASDELLEVLKKDSTAIDILINNAGVYSTDFVDIDQKSGWDKPDGSLWNNTMAVNLTAPFLLSQGLAPQMVQRSWGRIVNISSISGKKAECYGSAYSASKFGLIGLTQSLALELARHGITVNAVCPGWVETDMALDQINDPEWCRLNDLDPEESVDIARLSIPQMRFIQPDEVASLVGYLCSDRAKGITGQAINICGGLSIT